MGSGQRRPNSPSRRLERRFVAEPQAVPAARHAVDGMDLVLGQGTSRNVELLVSELVANAIRHGSRRPTDSIALRVWADDGSVRVEVADGGPGFKDHRRGRPGELRTFGWGLFLVDRLADRWGVGKGSAHRVWFELSP